MDKRLNHTCRVGGAKTTMLFQRVDHDGVSQASFRRVSLHVPHLYVE